MGKTFYIDQLKVKSTKDIQRHHVKIVKSEGYVLSFSFDSCNWLCKEISLVPAIKTVSQMFLKTNSLVFVPKRLIQALFIGHRNAESNLRALWPIFDYKNRLENRSELEENIKRRQLADKINVSDLYDKWELYKNCESEKEKIEKRRAQLTKSISKLKSAKSISEENRRRLETSTQEARTLRKNYDAASNAFHDIQERFNIDFLKLPNNLLTKTPNQEEIVYEFGTKPSVDHCQHHLNFDHLIKFIDETCYFLQGDAAKFDLTFPMECVKYLKQYDFAQFSNVDFAKTIIVEGAGIPLTNLYEVIHDFHENYTNLVHLVGNGSWLSFLSYIAKLKVDRDQLPLAFVSNGKIYHPPNTKDSNLFNAAQSTAIQIFSAGTEEQVKERFEIALDLIKHIYTSLNIHFRIVYLPAHRLQSAECFAASIEMYSPSLKQYVEVGNLSHFSNYISYRLRFQCERDETNLQYKPHIFGGTVCNVTKLLAILLESYNGCIPNSILNCKLSNKSN